jgi:hypothetical protein
MALNSCVTINNGISGAHTELLTRCLIVDPIRHGANRKNSGEHGITAISVGFKIISSPFTYVPRTCRGEPYVRPRTNNAFVPMYDGRT